MTNYQITVGYRSVLSIDVKAATEGEAKAKAIEIMNKVRDKINSVRECQIQDDTFNANSVLNMDETWNMI